MGGCEFARVVEPVLGPLTARGIPRSLAPFLQEYDLDDLDPDHAAHTLIERTLRYGSRAEVRWLFAHYGRAAIVHWVRRWGKHALPAPHLAFWRLLLGLEDTP
jgi:hypothetical protein